MPTLNAQQIEKALRRGVTPDEIKNYIRTGRTEAPPLEPEKEPGFLSSIFQKLNPFAEKAGQVGVGAVKGATKTLDVASKFGQRFDPFRAIQGKAPEGLADIFQKPDLLEPKGGAEKFGFAAERIGEFITAGQIARPATIGANTLLKAKLARTTLAPALQKTVRILAGSGLEGLIFGTTKLAQTGKPKEALKTGAITGAISIPFQALEVLREPIAASLTKGAVKKSTQALAPTTKANKQLAERVVPGLLKRKVIFGTRAGLRAQANAGIDLAGQQLDDAYGALPSTLKVQIAPIIKDLETAKTSLMVKGTNVIPRVAQGKYQALVNIQRELVNVASGKSSVGVDSLRNFRQILDSTIKKAGPDFGMTGKEKDVLFASKSMANAIRGELAKKFPDIAKANAEYNFWSNVKEVVEATIQRTAGRGHPLSKQIAESAGFVVGSTVGGTAGKAVAGGILFHFLNSIRNSPMLLQMSAVLRTEIAESLASGNASQIINVLEKVINATVATNIDED